MHAESANATLGLIEAGRIVAILRGHAGDADQVLSATLADAGITALELTVDSPDAFSRIGRLAQAWAGRMAIGAGTVRTVEQARRAADAGAAFIVSPNRDTAVIAAAVSLGLVAIPGCQTPSEIVEAVDAGAQAVKLFPAQALGPAFVRAVRAPLGDVRLVPTGGVTPELARAYRGAGAWALGAGSELLGGDLAQGIDTGALAARARAFAEAAR
ncbi:bifunctional 4-hydroxy-2-oxoglutarate aldolase/2-dehydro-3-deoxy-phosphogluconate aldolase [Luteimonas suaedae]|uniref:bifunctional 4-hydroxy-2-oxoglutarate aldolase/2-dehydro-3-deoxy-phosphogluconate aldolase n=1 Tax=Luteimonas suaedae TaxID=2605430 RepID=UPI0011ED32F4|nr:bifunctional 4-hydroxy-2-oxoglutarate aldolase/2-dehydro-3-deoxy-phosphogluconate aldolase [Luteimonas suaedae]